MQTALRNVIEPIFERDFAEHSYGFRPNRGCKEALRRVEVLLKAGYTYVVDADLKSYFDTIPHQPLMERVGHKIADGRVLKLIKAFLTQRVANVNWTARGWFEYFKHTSYPRKFRSLDGWIRRRLRRILLKRHKKHHHNGLGNAHHRWPNAFFAEQGLFSMETAYARIRQSAKR